jgi:hypothetical protein
MYQSSYYYTFSFILSDKRDLLHLSPPTPPNIILIILKAGEDNTSHKNCSTVWRKLYYTKEYVPVGGKVQNGRTSIINENCSGCLTTS